MKGAKAAGIYAPDSTARHDSLYDDLQINKTFTNVHELERALFFIVPVL